MGYSGEVSRREVFHWNDLLLILARLASSSFSPSASHKLVS